MICEGTMKQGWTVALGTIAGRMTIRAVTKFTRTGLRKLSILYHIDECIHIDLSRLTRRTLTCCLIIIKTNFNYLFYILDNYLYNGSRHSIEGAEITIGPHSFYTDQSQETSSGKQVSSSRLARNCPGLRQSARSVQRILPRRSTLRG
jgi:hypothetical protein